MCWCLKSPIHPLKIFFFGCIIWLGCWHHFFVFPCWWTLHSHLIPDSTTSGQKLAPVFYLLLRYIGSETQGSSLSNCSAWNKWIEALPIASPFIFVSHVFPWLPICWYMLPRWPIFFTCIVTIVHLFPHLVIIANFPYMHRKSCPFITWWNK